MARLASRISSPAVGLLLAAGVPALGAAELVRYSFDDGYQATGPDTFRVFDNASGKVGLSKSFRHSGYRSVVVTDRPGDGDFPELQGYFPLQRQGELTIQFALLVTNPDEPFNIALAGPRGFRLGRDGIAVWLRTKRDGALYHVSDSIPKRLFAPNPYAWYQVSVRYDIDSGRYDLTIRARGRDDPVASALDVPNAASQPASGVDKFSFIGDPADRSEAVYYVDDVRIAASDAGEPPPFVAPGRRKLFIDDWQALQRRKLGRPRCLPVVSLSDLGIDTARQQTLRAAGEFERLQRVLRTSPRLLKAQADDSSAVAAARSWRNGCQALADERADAALQAFRRARRIMPGAPMYAVSEALALAAAGRSTAADQHLAEVYGQWYGDARLAAAQAMLGLSRNRLMAAENALAALADGIDESALPAEVANLWSWGPQPDVVSALSDRESEGTSREVGQRLVMEQYYFVLLWQQRYAEAGQYAGEVAATLKSRGIPAGAWHELRGNAALLARRLDAAERFYKKALDDDGLHRRNRASVSEKLADVYYLRGDHDDERVYREAAYGSLH